LSRVIGIIGYHNSGKTTLIRNLARELMDRGHAVAVVKHLSHRVDVPGKDTTLLGEVVDQVGFISPEGSGVFWKKPLSLQDIIPHLEADIVLVEGFKAVKSFPKVVCLRGEVKDRELFDGLAICAVGPADHVPGLDIPIFGRDDVDRIADLVEQKAVELPD
jgi:molybdopterin-guanine dinucleotide biosynthesis protein B